MPIISKKIKVHPSLLNKNLKKNLLNLVIEQTKNECTEEYGYVILIVKLLRILGNIVTSSNSDIIFNIEFVAETLLPKIGDIFNGTVCLIFDRGIFVTVQNKLKVLIPIVNLQGYEYIKHIQSYYKNETLNKSIQKGDSLVFEITNIQYSKNNFNCIGKLV